MLIQVVRKEKPPCVEGTLIHHIRLRVYERGAGETLACGTGACAAVVAGIRWGLLDEEVDVHTHGGMLTISWAGGDAPVWMTGPVATVFEGSVEVPEFSDSFSD